MKKKPQVMSVTDGFMNRAQLASYLCVSIATVHNLVKSGHIPEPLKIGERIFRWKRADVDAYINSGRAAVSSEEEPTGPTIGDNF